MADYKSLRDLFKALEQKIEKAVQEKVPDVVEREMQVQIYEKVYEAYEPIAYERTYQLISPENIETTNVPGGVSIRNVREDEGKDVAYTVESGFGYSFPYIGMGPRRFTEATRQSLKESGKHIEAVRKGLIEQGLKVE